MSEKQLKIVSIFDQRGAEKVVKATEDLRKVYEQLGRSVKDVQKSLSELDNIQKRNTDSVSRENQALKEQIDRLKALREAHLGVAQAAKAYGSQSGYGGGGPPGGGYGSAANYGAPGGGGRMGGNLEGGRPDTSAYSGNYGAWRAAPWFTGAKVLGGLGAGAGLVGAGIGMYANWQQHAGRAETREQTQGLENLARAQSYRNSIFSESVSAPIGYQAIKAAAEFKLRNKNSGMTTLGPGGLLQGPEVSYGGNTTGSEIAGNVQIMSGSMKEHEGNINAGKAALGGAWAKGLGGLGVMAGGIGSMLFHGALGAAGGAIAGPMGSAVGAAFGGAPGAAIAGGGAMMIVSAIKEGTAANFQIAKAERDLKESGPEAEQSDRSVAAQKAMDEILAITKYQMGVFNQSASASSSFARQSLGGSFTGMPDDFDRSEALSMFTGARRGYGRNMRAGGMGSMFDAARRGMSAGAATETIGGFGEAGANGGQALRNLMALGVKAGMESLDMGYFEKLAVAASRSTYGSGGLRDPRVAGLMMAGLYRPTSHQVGENIKGDSAISGLFQSNSYYRARDQVNISAILGNEATNLKIRTLNQASMADLVGKGSSNIQSLGIGEAQLARIRSSRIGEIGNTIRGPEVDKMLGGKNLETFLLDVDTRLQSKNKGVRKEAGSQMDLLATALAGVTGEQFNDLIGGLRAAGASKAEQELMARKKGGVPGEFRQQGSEGTRVVAEQNRLQNKDIKGGIRAAKGWEAANKLMANPEFREWLDEEGRGELKQRWESTGGAKPLQERMSADINAAGSSFYHDAAIKAGEGDDATQKLNKSLGDLDGVLKRLTSDELQKDLVTLAANFHRLSQMSNVFLRTGMGGPRTGLPENP